MSDLPAPLTPPDCDVQDFSYMPLHVARLRDSDLAAEESPEACWYAVLLWAASWHQIPAASLPDNETVLCKLIGLGRDLKTFRKHRAAMMRGFVLCSDGRFYHPVVAERANISWESKLQQRWRTECGRVKKANQRNDTAIPVPGYEAFVLEYRKGLSPGTQPIVPGDIASKGEGEGEGEGDSIEDAYASGEKPALEFELDLPEDPDGAPVILLPEQVVEAWNAMAHRTGLPKVAKLTDARRKHLKTRIAQHPIEDFISAIAAIERSPFCLGDSKGGWRADFDFLLQPSSFVKLIEGSYDRGQ